MKKPNNQNIMKVAKSTLALVIAGTFSFSTISFAEDNKDTNEIQTIDLQEIQTDLETVQVEAPSIVPGDFFYFAKIALEKIKLAFTFDNDKEAKLLATFASERLTEASVLFGNGNEEEALQIIKAAIEYIEESQEIIDSGTNQEDQTSTEDEPTDESTDIEQEANSEDKQNTPGEEANQDENTDERDPINETETLIRNNIAALTAAMQHVGNDNARAQLQKNIDKTYAKISKKLAKLEEKYHLADNDAQEDTNIETVEVPESPILDNNNPTSPVVEEEPGKTSEAETITLPNVQPRGKAAVKQNKVKQEKPKADKPNHNAKKVKADKQPKGKKHEKNKNAPGQMNKHRGNGKNN